MKKIKTIYLFLMAVASMSLTSCSENYSNGNRVGTLTQFSKTGVIWKSYEGHLNVTQTGMNTANGFDFSIDNDNEPSGLVATLDSAQNLGWKVELKYHEVYLKNWFSNRGHTNHFVTECKVLDRSFNSIFSNKVNNTDTTSVKTVTKDTIVTITVTFDEARKMGWIK